ANQGGSVYAGMSAAIPEKKLKKLAHFRPEWWLTFVRNQWLSLVRNSHLCDPHRASIMGLDREQPLRGIKMSSPDIRAGVALLIAALSATGESKISNVEQIDRGYQNIEWRLKKLGAQIERIG
ncbi:MAG: hypothetical protein ACK5Q9_09180, partial [Cyclobacteriaceae bacterium]